MANYDRTNSGFIGKNQREKRDGRKDPDITGTANINGLEYWVAGWKNAKGYGLKFTRKDDRGSPPARTQERSPQRGPQRAAPAPAEEFEDDSIPF